MIRTVRADTLVEGIEILLSASRDLWSIVEDIRPARQTKNDKNKMVRITTIDGREYVVPESTEVTVFV